MIGREKAVGIVGDDLMLGDPELAAYEDVINDLALEQVTGKTNKCSPRPLVFDHRFIHGIIKQLLESQQR